MEEPGSGEPNGEIKGVLLAFASMAADESALARLADADREACSEARRRLQAFETEARESVLSRWRGRAATGIPDGIERLHPSWIAWILSHEPPDVVFRIREAVPEGLAPTVDADARGGGTTLANAAAALPAEVARIALTPLARLCEEPCGPCAAALVALTFDDLERELARLGARTLAHSLAGNDATVRARAMALAGAPWAAVMGDAFREPISPAERKTALAHVASNVEASAHGSTERLAHIGLAALKAQLVSEHPGSPFRVAGRLPAALGRRLIEW